MRVFATNVLIELAKRAEAVLTGWVRAASISSDDRDEFSNRADVFAV